MNNIPDLPITNAAIPQLGMGTWQVTDPAQYKTMFEAAIAAGYRHFDSAQIYKNEQLLGEHWKTSGIKREDLFLTTKVSPLHFWYSQVAKDFQVSLDKLQTDYVDLLLLHFPVPVLRKKAWRALEELQAAGTVKNIGVSNYTIRHLEQMKRYANVMPAVNQVELHVFLQQPELLKYCREEGIVVEAYSPLAHARSNDNPVIADIAKRSNKSYAQIMLRWCVEQGLVVIPKSVTPSRIAENAQIFDFKLSPEDLELLDQQNRNLRTLPNPKYML